MNAVIHSAVCAAQNLGWEIYGIRDGYDGILEPQKYREGGIRLLRYAEVRQIPHRGGTILGTTNRGNPFAAARVQADGSRREVDRSDEAVAAFRTHQGR